MAKKINRLGELKYNNQGCLMKIIEYNLNRDVVVEFQDKYKAKIHTSYQMFSKGIVKNPYYPTVCGVGISGLKYPITINNKKIKEYEAWRDMIRRCYDEKYKSKNTAYKDVTCCDDWLLYENFYEWLHSQENFDKWLNGDRWALDKDILIKNNKTYSPNACCLVSQNVNSLFLRNSKDRGDLPIGVTKYFNKFFACCTNSINFEQDFLGLHSTPEEAFLAYKICKEEIIKNIAQIEYSKGNITKLCYEAMMNYEVEIDD